MLTPACPPRRSPVPKTSKPSRSLLRQRAELLLQTEISFIPHKSFSRLSPEKVEQLEGPLHVAERKSHEHETRTVLSPLFKTPLLTGAGEVHLFRRMNYLKYRANRLRRQIDPQSPQIALLNEIEDCLRRAEQSRDLLVTSNLRLVAAIAKKIARTHFEFEELLSEGNLIVLNAVDKFDFGRGFRFSTYATHSVQRHFYRQLQRQLTLKTRFRPADPEILQDIAANPVPEHESDNVDLHRQIRRELKQALDERERGILTERFGLTGDEKTLEQVAAEMGLSKERVRQLQHRALDKLRERITADGSCVS